MYTHLANSQNILISGCGGGYDIFCGLDLYLNLIKQGKKVILGNYTFTKKKLLKKGEKVSECCYKVLPNVEFDEQEYLKDMCTIVMPSPEELKKMHYTEEEYRLANKTLGKVDVSCYFPEYKLAKLLNVPIYCFIQHNTGIKNLTEAYNTVINLENLDTVILMDGGTDSLMTGQEDGLGTPFEDVSSIVAVFNSNVKNKFLYCLGYNVDKFHGVSDHDFLKNTADLIKNNYFIGAYMLNKKDESTQKYIDIFMKCDPEKSIVNSHIVAAIQGHFGNYCPDWLNERLANQELYIHPLMALYWIYELDGIYKNLKYDVDKLKESNNIDEIDKLLFIV